MRYQAIFADGTLFAIETKRECTVALKVVRPDGGVLMQFCKNRKAAESLASDYTRLYSIPKHDFSKSADDDRKENAEFRANCKICYTLNIEKQKTKTETTK